MVTERMLNVMFTRGQNPSVADGRRYPWQRATRYVSRHAAGRGAPAPGTPPRTGPVPRTTAHAVAWVGTCVAALLLLCLSTGALDTLFGGADAAPSPRSGRGPGTIGAAAPTPSTGPSTTESASSATQSPAPATESSAPAAATPAPAPAATRGGGGPDDGGGSGGGGSGGGGSGGGSGESRPPRGRDPKFDTCEEANAHGYGPYLRGKDPEYNWYRDEDTDADGVVCD